jgi:cytochrome oxidase assembly protein ShyY1
MTTVIERVLAQLFTVKSDARALVATLTAFGVRTALGCWRLWKLHWAGSGLNQL